MYACGFHLEDRSMRVYVVSLGVSSCARAQGGLQHGRPVY